MLRWKWPQWRLDRWSAGTQNGLQALPWIQHMRGGDRTFYEAAWVAARHAMDVGTNHSADDPGFPFPTDDGTEDLCTGFVNGVSSHPFPWRCKHKHKGVKIGYLVLMYHLTGDERARDVLREVLEAHATASEEVSPDCDEVTDGDVANFTTGGGREHYNMNLFWKLGLDELLDPGTLADQELHDRIEVLREAWLEKTFLEREEDTDLPYGAECGHYTFSLLDQPPTDTPIVFMASNANLADGIVAQRDFVEADPDMLQRWVEHLQSRGMPDTIWEGMVGYESLYGASWIYDLETADETTIPGTTADEWAKGSWDFARGLADLVPDFALDAPLPLEMKMVEPRDPLSDMEDLPLPFVSNASPVEARKLVFAMLSGEAVRERHLAETGIALQADSPPITRDVFFPVPAQCGRVVIRPANAGDVVRVDVWLDDRSMSVFADPSYGTVEVRLYDGAGFDVVDVGTGTIAPDSEYFVWANEKSITRVFPQSLTTSVEIPGAILNHDYTLLVNNATLVNGTISNSNVRVMVAADNAQVVHELPGAFGIHTHGSKYPVPTAGEVFMQSTDPTFATLTFNGSVSTMFVVRDPWTWLELYRPTVLDVDTVPGAANPELVLNLEDLGLPIGQQLIAVVLAGARTASFDLTPRSPWVSRTPDDWFEPGIDPDPAVTRDLWDMDAEGKTCLGEFELP